MSDHKNDNKQDNKSEQTKPGAKNQKQADAKPISEHNKK